MSRRRGWIREARIELREMFRRLAAEGKTILVSSHILTELAEMCDVVGIIEQGRMVAVGSVAEIERESRLPHQNWVEVRVLGEADGLATWLTVRGDVAEMKIEGESITFSHAGDEGAEANLLQEMIAAGFRVVAFGSRRRSLEDVFMQVTAGLVQ